MAGKKISALPSIASPQLADIFAVVQGNVTYKETITQLVTLLNSNIQITEAQVTGLVADLASKLNLSGGTMSGVIDMNSHKITNVTDPTAAQDAATKFYVDDTVGNYLPLSGGTMTGAVNMNNFKITNLGLCTNSGDAANKGYVDSVATGLNIQAACYAATTANLTATYANGAAGIGATLTNAGAFAVFSIDGVSPAVGERVLIKDQSSTLENGIYTVTTAGDAVSVNWVLTRATDYNQPSQIQPGDLVVVNNGTTNATTSWIETASVSAVGTDPILFSQFTFSPTAYLLKANNLSDVLSVTTAFNNISPSTTKGDLIVFDGTNNVRFAVGGTDGQIIRVKAAASSGLAYSSAAYPETAGSVGNVLTSDGTNFVSSAPAANTGFESSLMLMGG